MLDINALDRILNQVIKETLEVLERRKTQVYEISENSRVELARVKDELAEVQSRVTEVVSRIDFVTSVEKKAQMKLTQLHISVRSAQGELKKAYEEIYALKVESVKLKEEEKSLKRREEELELSLRQILAAVEKAEKMISQVGIVLNFLGSGLQNVTEKIGEVQQAQQMALSIMRAQEEERKRLAREIHDIPAQSMANIVMRAEYCLKLLDLDPAKVREELITLQNLVRSSLNDVRKIIFDLRPMALDDLGLVPATKRYLTEYKEQNAPQVEFFVFGLQRRLDSSVEVALFRIIQEAITN
ncbi:MAG: sensor histidine kinase, partial [Eubacteriales bacterium]